MYYLELWKPVVGYEGLYEVSNYGRVASLNYNNSGKRHLLKQFRYRDYLRLQLWKDGKGKSYRVNRLVAEAFIPNPENKPEVGHWDCNPSNNCVSNLYWCTSLENNRHLITRKRRSESMKGKKMSEEAKKNMSEALKGKFINRPDLSKPVLQFTKDGTFIAEYQSLREAERQTQIKCSSISACCLGKPKHKSAGGFGWKYKEVG